MTAAAGLKTRSSHRAHPIFTLNKIQEKTLFLKKEKKRKEKNNKKQTNIHIVSWLYIADATQSYAKF